MADPEKSEEQMAADFVRRLGRDILTRHFPSLGWNLVFVPLDLIEYRGAARMYLGTRYGYRPDEVIELRARRLTMDSVESTYWVLAIPEAAVERRRSEAARETD